MPNKKMKLGVPHQEGQLSMMFVRGGPRDGAGRKGIGVTKKLSLTLPQETWDQLEALGAQKNCSRSELLRTIVEAFLSESTEREGE
ncbi:MAG: hypothetical protein K0R75_1131 [Paenibacillaceae bacterium]|jgi:hypothetical protein|nr:hypothetical protein [Paenibacillaceae bacterium]